MKYLNFKLPAAKQLLLIILSFCSLLSHGTSKVLIKANILRGESFVTVKSSAKEIENRVSEILTKKGFAVIDKLEPTADMLFVDLFVYQFLAQYPAITVTIRTKDGVHYIDQEYKKIFVDRDLTNLNLAAELAERVPADINKDLVYKIRMDDILSTNKTNSSTSDAMYIAKATRSDYFSTIKWGDDDKVPFIIPNELQLYLLYASNYTGMKKHLARGPIVLKLKINNSARLELVTSNSNSTLDENQKGRIQEFIDAFPMWITDTPTENIEIMYGLK